MFAKANPGTCRVAAILPTKPGTQKLTPPSSAREFVVAVTTRLPASGPATTNFRQANEWQNFCVKNLEKTPLAHMDRPKKLDLVLRPLNLADYECKSSRLKPIS